MPSYVIGNCTDLIRRLLWLEKLKIMHTCPCCSSHLLRHINIHEVYWLCRHCRQAMPVLSEKKYKLSPEFEISELSIISRWAWIFMVETRQRKQGQKAEEKRVSDNFTFCYKTAVFLRLSTYLKNQKNWMLQPEKTSLACNQLSNAHKFLKLFA